MGKERILAPAGYMPQEKILAFFAKTIQQVNARHKATILLYLISKEKAFPLEKEHSKRIYQDYHGYPHQSA